MTDNDERCAVPRCPNTPSRIGLCSTHYQKRLDTGRTGFVSSEPVMRHLQRLLELGWDVPGIAAMSGASESNLYRMLRDPRPNCFMAVARRVLAVELVPMSVTGAVRRIRAMLRAGWFRSEIAAAAGVSIDTVSGVVYRNRCSVPTVAAIRKAYDLLGEKVPTSPDAATARQRKTGATKAATRGYVSPAAWDDIDDLGEDPGRPVARCKWEKAPTDEVVFLASFGKSAAEIALKFDVTEAQIRAKLQREEAAA